MKMRVAWIIFVFFITGCAAHEVRKEKDNLYFVLRNPEAKSVLFAYSLDGFRCHEASKDMVGTWVVGVPAGDSFRYFYLVDGVPYTPPCPLTETDDFGAKNCLYEPGM